MGCCISTNTESPGSKKHVGSDEASSKLKCFSHESRAPPPPPSVEEETVKEVLSETPKPIPPQPESAQVRQDLQEEEEKEKETKKISAHRVEVFAKIQENQNLGSNEEIMSEVSEFCSDSISESVSTMTNVTDKRDNEEEEEQRVRQRRRVVSRSPAKPPPRNGLKRDPVVNQSPNRRSDQSPGSRISNGSSARLVQYQESGRVNGLIRRDPSESSGRRSRSPATTRSSAPMGRSPSARRTNRSPGRVGSGPSENNNAPSINNNRRKMEAKQAGDNSNDNCSTNESIENPLVSLECFIFL